jgi:sensor histidine kinase regulating citrate/malate metabolism
MRRKHEWVKEYPGGITVCDSRGIILELNKRAVESLSAEGGKKLIGTNLMGCHPEPARTKLKRMMKNRQTNVYTVQKGRTRKIILQTPWYKKGKYRGFVEVSLPITGKIPNIVRKP